MDEHLAEVLGLSPPVNASRCTVQLCWSELACSGEREEARVVCLVVDRVDVAALEVEAFAELAEVALELVRLRCCHLADLNAE